MGGVESGVVRMCVTSSVMPGVDDWNALKRDGYTIVFRNGAAGALAETEHALGCELPRAYKAFVLAHGAPKIASEAPLALEDAP